MGLDPQNHVVALCIQGMAAEGAGDAAAAQDAYQRAWRAAADDVEAAVAAHYVARHQSSPTLTLQWNQVALDRALASDPGQTAALLPSLHLNLGRALEDAGRVDDALDQYRAARDCSPALDDDGYGQMLRAGVAQALARLER